MTEATTDETFEIEKVITLRRPIKSVAGDEIRAVTVRELDGSEIAEFLDSYGNEPKGQQILGLVSASTGLLFADAGKIKARDLMAVAGAAGEFLGDAAELLAGPSSGDPK